MEPSEQTLFEFYDGDFTFHVAEYKDEPPRTFRVRIDCTSPEERARQNSENANETPGNWERIRPATSSEIRAWLRAMWDILPTRKPQHTLALRALALHGPLAITRDTDYAISMGLWELTGRDAPVLRNFMPSRERLVETRDGLYHLTETGKWLVTLMK